MDGNLYDFHDQINPSWNKKGANIIVNPLISGGSDPVKLNGTTIPTYGRDVLTNRSM